MTAKNKEGTLYKTFTIEGESFEIKYGYETSKEKSRGWQPTPIYPDFTETPRFTSKGYPFVTVYQGACEYYEAKNEEINENWCANCTWMERNEKYVGVCRCERRREERKTDF